MEILATTRNYTFKFSILLFASITFFYLKLQCGGVSYRTNFYFNKGNYFYPSPIFISISLIKNVYIIYCRFYLCIKLTIKKWIWEKLNLLNLPRQAPCRPWQGGRGDANSRASTGASSETRVVAPLASEPPTPTSPKSAPCSPGNRTPPEHNLRKKS